MGALADTGHVEGEEAGLGADADWRFLAGDREQGRFEIAAGDWQFDPPPTQGLHLVLERGAPQEFDPAEPEVETDLGVASEGGCKVEPALADNLYPVSLHLLDEAPSEDAQTLRVQVQERGCASERDPRPHLNTPVINHGSDAVTVYWTSSAPGGPVTCPGNPWVATELELGEPLGDRQLLDGSVWPPRPVTERADL